MKHPAGIGLLLMFHVAISWSDLAQDAEAAQYADIQLQYLYSSWEPSEIVNADTETSGRNLIKISLDPSPSLPFIERLEYWWTPGDSADQQALIEPEAEGDSAFERYIGTLQYVFVGENRIYYNFESTAFIGEAKINQPVEYIDNDNQVTLLQPGDEINFLTVIREHEIGVDLSGMDVELSNFFDSWGLFYQYSDYERPYSLTFDRRFLDERIFEANIVAHGLGIRMDGEVALSEGVLLGYGFTGVSGKGIIEFSNADLDDFIDDDKKLYSHKITYHLDLLWRLAKFSDLSLGFRHEILEIDSRLESDDVESAVNHLEENMRFLNIGLSIRI